MLKDGLAMIDITPFTFTPEEYLIAWDENLDAGDGYEVWRNIWAHGRGQGYEIRQAALKDPSAKLVRRRTEKDISTAEIAGKTLGCIERCFSGDSFAAYFNGALALISQGTADNPAHWELFQVLTLVQQILAGDSMQFLQDHT